MPKIVIQQALNFGVFLLGIVVTFVWRTIFLPKKSFQHVVTTMTVNNKMSIQIENFINLS